jgi:fructose-1,6-bisphosphatase I
MDQENQSIKDLPIGLTIDRFISRYFEKQGQREHGLAQLLRDIVLAGKVIHLAITKAGLGGIENLNPRQNNLVENQKKLDLVSGIRFNRALAQGKQVCAILSGENEGVVDLGNNKGQFVVCMDPLDGSSNMDVNVSVGTLFGIYERKSQIGKPFEMSDFLQPGKQQIAAGYLLFGSSTMLVITMGSGVFGFTYEPNMGEFFLSHPFLRIPNRGPYYSINFRDWESQPNGVHRYIDQCREQNLDMRYIGSLVADFHRNLLKGGIYLYPSKKGYPHGKLRLQYECNPLAMIVEQAGGRANSGEQQILDIIPEWPHQKSPLFIGSTDMVSQLIDFFTMK